MAWRICSLARSWIFFPASSQLRKISSRPTIPTCEPPTIICCTEGLDPQEHFKERSPSNHSIQCATVVNSQLSVKKSTMRLDLVRRERLCSYRRTGACIAATECLLHHSLACLQLGRSEAQGSVPFSFRYQTVVDEGALFDSMAFEQGVGTLGLLHGHL